jgi:Na+-translocating ferredoxin:NAD+ oxidoreductase RnfD subunit
MSAHAAPAAGRPVVVIRGTPYPVLLPKLSDPRLHLAATITSLQVLGQAAFHFRLSIAQILISLATCAVLEVAIAARRQRVLMWPASALLTGNGVAFILRVPGTRHGDWWSLRGWWIFVATAGISLLSKHVIQWRGGHIFNPSNFGLVLCFVILGRSRAEPLDFWWGPMSPWLGLAFAIIVTGGLAILSRLKLLWIAAGFWLSFAAGIGLLALTGHEMTARWHLGPLGGAHLWWVLLSSPEVFVFLFFMITDPKTAPKGAPARIVYAVCVGLLAALLIAPTGTEYAAKVALLCALFVVCLVRPLAERLPELHLGGRRLVVLVGGAVAVYTAGLVAAGIPGRGTAAAAPPATGDRLPAVTILRSRGVDSKLTTRTARLIARDLFVALGTPPAKQTRVKVWLEPGQGQSPPIAVAQLARVTYRLNQVGSEWTLARPGTTQATPAAPRPLKGFRLMNVAPQVGVRFRQDSFRFGVTSDPTAMMGGGVCWLDYDGDGRLDLFVVNSYSDSQYAEWSERGGAPTSALYRNEHGRFVDVSKSAHAGLPLRGDGCVAADLDGDGYTDLFVTTAVDDVLLWNDGDGTFTEGARTAGVVSFGWHTGAAAADVNGDGRPDLYVAGYTDAQHPIPTSTDGFPSNFPGVRDELFLNEGHRRFRNVAAQVGLDRAPYDHSLGAVFTDVNGDGRPDLYVANDEDPNRLYVNEPGGALGVRLAQRGGEAKAADANAGMGVAAADRNGDGRDDFFVSNSRGQTHAVYDSTPGLSFEDVRRSFASAFGKNLTGWGDSWVDLANDGRLELVLANGAIPVTDVARDAGPVQVLARGADGSIEDAGSATQLLVNGRGVAAADYDNDGRVDLAVNSVGGPLLLLHNTTRGGHWLEVAVEPFAPGARVTAVLPDGRRITRDVQAGSSYLSSEDPRVHFGLGRATTVKRLIVRFPDGHVSRLSDVRADRIVTVR